MTNEMMKLCFQNMILVGVTLCVLYTQSNYHNFIMLIIVKVFQKT